MNPIALSILKANIYALPLKQGRPRIVSIDYILDRISYILRTGCQWTNLPTDKCSWKTVYHYFSQWSHRHVFERSFQDMVRFYVTRKGLSKDLLVDTSFVKNVYGRDCVGRSPVDRGRKATKLSVLTDADGTPLTMLFHPGNKSDCRTLYHLLLKSESRLPLRGHVLHADRGYDTSHCHTIVTERDMTSNIARKRIPSLLKDTKRVVVEYTFAWLDKFRRIIMRYDGLVKHFRSFHCLASIHIIAKRVL